MGELNKLLVKLNRKTLLQHVLSNLKQSEVDEILVVTGHQKENVKQSIGQFNVQCVENDQYIDGLSSSIKIGVESLTGHTDAVLICHGDMPFVNPMTINKLVDTYIDRRQIVIPNYKGQKGNPLIWPKEYFNDLTKLSGDSGARQTLADYKNKIIQLEVNDVGILLDIDDPQTLEFMQSKFDKE